MKWVLIIVFIHGYGPRPLIHTQEFGTLLACEEAGKKSVEMYGRISGRVGRTGEIEAVCTELSK